MERIAYIELDTHAEIAANFMELMKDSEQFSVDYYFSPKIFKQIGTNSQRVFDIRPEALLAVLKEEKYALVIIGTVHRYFDLFFKVTGQFNTSVIVHNLNFTKISSLQLLENVFKKDFTYRLKLLLKEDLLSAPKVFEKAANLLVLDESLLKTNPQSKLNSLPVFFLNEYESERKSNITVVIPGAVSQERRNYRRLLERIKTFSGERHFQFVFLGKAAGKELQWLKDFEKDKLQNISLKYFTEKVPQQLFDEWMQRAEILWCPLQPETEFFSQKEYYGITKLSGNLGDAIKYGKIAVFPSDYPNSNRFIIPEHENVEDQLYTLTKVTAYDFKEKYAKEKVLKTLEETLRKFL